MGVDRQNGFTIVELLIVIIVIAILATITVATYNGITQKASDAQKASIAKTVEKSLENFYTLNDRYPGVNEINSEADLQKLGLHQTDVAPTGCAPTNAIKYGGLNSSTCGFIYVASPNTDGTGFACNSPTVCRHFRLSYWSKSTNQAVMLSRGR